MVFASIPLRIESFLFENSIFLFFGVAAGFGWANIHPASYTHFAHFTFFENAHIGTPSASGMRAIDIHFIVSEFLMAFFLR
jgi:hypothetical protein